MLGDGDGGVVIAALFVETGGCYFGLPDVDPWDKARDARDYRGPWSVVAHPPCERWGNYWFGGPTVVRRGTGYLTMGDDRGCFAAALRCVRQFGGVLEHPQGSHAWEHYGLKPPGFAGWTAADFMGGWTCRVEQGAYGHRARKATWLYAAGVDLPSLAWGRADGSFDLLDVHGGKGQDRARLIKTGICQQMSKRQRAATPIPFRDLLLSIARTARRDRDIAA